MSRRITLAAAISISLAATACSAGGAGDLPPSPTTVEVGMKEYQFDFVARAPHRGRVVFHVTNTGRLLHELALIPLPEDLPPIREQVQGGNRVFVRSRADAPPLSPGKSDVFAADLTPGRWGFVCYFFGPEGNHASKGMAAEFRVP